MGASCSIVLRTITVALISNLELTLLAFALFLSKRPTSMAHFRHAEFHLMVVEYLFEELLQDPILS